MKPNDFFHLVKSKILSVSLRVKVMGIALGMVLLLGITITYHVRERFKEELREELKMAGISSARELASRSSGFILTPNQFALNLIAKDIIENSLDARYAFVVSPSNNIFALTFERGFPIELLDVNKAKVGSRFNMEILDTEEGLIVDVAVPILDGKAGVARVGMSEKRMWEKVNTITLQLLAVTAIISFFGIIAAYLLTIVLTRPILQLVELANALGEGNFKTKSKDMGQ